MRASEKYAELEAAGLERPCCECHKEPMYWTKNVELVAGGRWICSVHERERHRLDRLKHREQRLSRCRQWYVENLEAAREKSRLYQREHREERRAYNRLWRENNREKMLETARHYRETHREERRKSQKRWYEEHREEVREYNRRWRAENQEKIAEYRRRDVEKQRARNARIIWMFGQRFTAPDQDFKEFAIALREERRRHQTERKSNG